MNKAHGTGKQDTGWLPTRREAFVGTIVFASGIVGNLFSEWLKAYWATDNDLMKAEVLEVRAKVVATIDGDRRPKTAIDCEAAIETLQQYRSLYHSEQAIALLDDGIEKLRFAKIGFDSIEIDKEFNEAVSKFLEGAGPNDKFSEDLKKALEQSNKRTDYSASVTRNIIDGAIAIGKTPLR